jgi:hypothetical protein
MVGDIRNELSDSTDVTWQFHPVEVDTLPDGQTRRPSEFIDDASLRIEYRPLPTQPSVADVVGLQCLVAGLLRGIVETDHPLATLEWEDARASFYAVVEDGLDAEVHWVTAGGERTTEPERVYDEVFDLARRGLADAGISDSVRERYLRPIEARWERRTTPSAWKLSRVQRAVEDGATPEVRDACRRVVREAGEQGLDCRTLQLDDQARIVDRVMDQAGLGRDDAVRTVLLGSGEMPTNGGRVRNLIHLATAGIPHLMLDEDLTLAPRRDPSVSGGVDLETRGWSLWFHPDADAAAAWGESGDFDPVVAHYEALGLGGAQALRRFARSPEDLAGLDLRAVERMTAGSILGTQSGLYGDAASANNIWYFTAGGASLDRFQADAEAYEHLRTTRYLARTRNAHAFQSVGAFSPVGGANDRMLPPTLHIGRNEDTFYTAVLHSLYPHSRVLEFPWALGHFPEERGWPELAWDVPFTGNLSRFLARELIGLSHQVPEITGEARYRLLSQRLAALAADSDRQLLDQVAAFQVAMRTNWIQRLNQARRDARRPGAGWERDIKATIRVNGQSLESGVPRRVHGMPEGMSDAEAAAWLRQRIESMSRMMAAWPALWQAASELQPLKPMGVVTP